MNRSTSLLLFGLCVSLFFSCSSDECNNGEFCTYFFEPDSVLTKVMVSPNAENPEVEVNFYNKPFNEETEPIATYFLRQEENLVLLSIERQYAKAIYYSGNDTIWVIGTGKNSLETYDCDPPCYDVETNDLDLSLGR